jgi:hypothetical protein
MFHSSMSAARPTRIHDASRSSELPTRPSPCAATSSNTAVGT